MISFALGFVVAASLAQAGPDMSWQRVQQQFHDGDAERAITTARGCANKNVKCKQLLAEIDEFNEKMKLIETLGPAELISLLELDRRIAGGTSSALAKPIIARAVTANYTKASNCRAKGDWACAMDYAKKVLNADPGHVGAQAIVMDARAESKQEYLRKHPIDDTPFEYTPDGTRIIHVSDFGDDKAAPTKPTTTTAPAAPTIKIDSAKSELYVKTQKDGMASAFAHNHVARAEKVSGTLVWDAAHPDNSKLKISINVDDLVVDDPALRKRIGGDYGSEVSKGDRDTIRANMLGDSQLDAKKFTTIELTSVGFSSKAAGDYIVDADFTMHGVTKLIRLHAKISGEPNAPVGEGSFKLNVSDYGIKPYSAGLGTIKNKDEVEIVFRLVTSG